MEVTTTHPENGDFNADFLPLENEAHLREKTSLRMVYEAQVNVLRRQLGSLEKIRQDLGLSQRKMAQLLLVDPSAWTRWTRNGEIDSAPPHIWRALQWYLTLQEKIPGLNQQYFSLHTSPIKTEATQQKIQSQDQKIRNLEILWLEKEKSAQNQLTGLQNEIKNLQKTQDFYRKWVVFLLVSLGISMLFFVRGWVQS